MLKASHICICIHFVCTLAAYMWCFHYEGLCHLTIHWEDLAQLWTTSCASSHGEVILHLLVHMEKSVHMETNVNFTIQNEDHFRTSQLLSDLWNMPRDNGKLGEYTVVTPVQVRIEVMWLLFIVNEIVHFDFISQGQTKLHKSMLQETLTGWILEKGRAYIITMVNRQIDVDNIHFLHCTLVFSRTWMNWNL